MSNSRLNRLAPGLVAMLFAIAMAAPALAQEAPPPNEAQPAAAEETAAPDEENPYLEEITVTAQKREENVQEVPLAVTSLPAETLETLTAGGGDVKSLSGRVPSLVLESSFGRAFPRFYIRGLGNTDFDLNASQPVSMVVDEVVLENPVVKGMPLWDLDRTEVLRGPQGTLFGRNTPAGIVKFEPRKPRQAPDASVRLSYGRYGTIDAKAAVGGGISDTLSGRVSVLFQSQQDWIDNKFNGDELGGYRTGAFRGQLLWQPNDKGSALLNLHGWKLDGTARIFRANMIKPGTDQPVAGFEQDVVFQDGRNEQDISARGGMLRLKYDFGFAELTSVTGYESISKMFSRGDIDGGFGAVFAPPMGPGFIPFPSESADGLPKLDQYTEELRLASHTGGLFDYLVGFFYFDEDMKAETFSYNSLAGNVLDGYAFQTQKTKSYAFFASGDYRPTDRWTLKAGLRYTNDEKDFAAERPDPTFQTPTVRPIKVDTSANLTTWDLSASFKVNSDVNVYGRVGTGFRAPSIQGRILFCADFAGGTDPATNCVSVAQEEKLMSEEIGIKTELLDRRLRLNLAGYTYQVDGQQIVAVGGQFNTATLLNADKTNGYGFELDIDFAPVSQWMFTIGTSYNHTEIDDENLGVAPCGGGCTVLDPIVSGTARVDGNPLPHAPEWIFDGLVDYKQPIGQGVFSGSIDWAYHSVKSFFLYQSKEFRGDSFELGARFGYLFGNGAYELALYGRNLTDEVVIQNGIDFNNLTGMTNDPRMYGLEFVWKF